MPVSVMPVIHYASDEQALRNAARAFDAGCAGVFLIEMEGNDRPLPSVARAVKERWPGLLVGINFLGSGPEEAVLANVALGLDMTWTDAQLTHSSGAPWALAGRVREAAARAPGHLVFAGVSFKHQMDEPRPNFAARKAVEFGFVPTTSGAATGVAAPESKIAALRAGLAPDAPLAIASGIDPANVLGFAPFLTHVLVATGVSSSFHEFDETKLRRLQSLVG
jgi:predicted TIM-barrel enzyme